MDKAKHVDWETGMRAAKARALGVPLPEDPLPEIAETPAGMVASDDDCSKQLDVYQAGLTPTLQRDISRYEDTAHALLDTIDGRLMSSEELEAAWTTLRYLNFQASEARAALRDIQHD